MDIENLLARARLTCAEWLEDEDRGDWWQYQHDYEAMADALTTAQAQAADLSTIAVGLNPCPPLTRRRGRERGKSIPSFTERGIVMAAKDEMPENLIYMHGEEYAQHNAFISGFAYGRMTTLDSEMAMHWWCRGYERDPYCHGSAENLLAALTTAQAQAAAQEQRIAELEGALLKIADDLGVQFLVWVESGCEGKDAIRLVANISQFARAALGEQQ